MSSDNVQLLSYTSNIAGGATIYTEKVLLGQYISLSILGYANKDLTVALQFSGDGTNWDYTVSNNLLTGSNSIITSPVIGKWTRLRITNLGGVATSTLRLFVYGTPSNSSISAQISKIGNFDPSISISNMPLSTFGDLRVAELEPRRNYVFSKCTLGAMNPKGWQLPYSDLQGSASDVMSQIRPTNGLVGIYGTVLPGVAMLTGAPIRYEPGQGITARFTGLFVQGLKNAAGLAPTTQYLGVGNGSYSARTVDNFLGFGYINQGLASNTDNFGIIYIRTGVRTFVPHTVWNVDKADGTYQLPLLDFTKVHVYMIQIQYLGAGAITFYIENPLTGTFLPVHRMSFDTGVSTSLGQPELGLLMYQTFEAGSVPVTAVDYVASASFALGVDGKFAEPIDRFAVNNSKAIGAATETLVMSVQNNTSFYGSANYKPLTVDQVSVSADGNKPVLFNVYRNCTIGGAPVYTQPYTTLSPHYVDVAGTFGGLGTGELMFSFTVGKNSDQTIDLMAYALSLKPGDILTVTAYSAQVADVVACLNVHIQ